MERTPQTLQDIHVVMGEFMRMDRLHRCVMEKYIHTLGIHRSQHMLLMHLFRAEHGSPSQKELAEHLGISPAAVAVTLKKLERQGYIEREAALSDNRYNEIRITESGRKIVEQTHRYFDAVERLIFSHLSSDELGTLSVCLKKMQDSLRQIESGEVSIDVECDPPEC